MKKVFFLLAMFTCIFASCSDGGNEEPVTPPTQKPEVNDTPAITIDSTIQSSGLSFDVSASEKSITFSTTADWTLSIAETRSGTEWCTASPTSGGKGTATVKFKTTENTEPEDRSVAVTIKAGTASKTFTVTQKGNKSLLVTTKKYELPKEGGEIEIEVKANVEYEMTIAESAKEWITEATGRALTTHKHILAIAASEEAVKREGEITFKSGDIVETVKVYQAGEAVLLLSKNEFTVSEAGETISVDLKSNVDFGVQMPDVDWITEEDASRAMSSHTLKFVVAENETSEARSAEIVFYDKNSDLKNTLKVAQSAKKFENRVVTLLEPGTLKELLGDDMLKITSLKIVGPINYYDLSNVSQMLGSYKFEKSEWGKLTVIDLSETTILGNYGASTNSFEMNQFEKCSNLQNIILPNSLTYIDQEVFSGCLALKSITIPDNVKGIDFNAFEGCTSLTTVNIGKGVTRIRDYAFRRCTALTSITIPNNVTELGAGLFEECTSLTSASIGKGVTKLESGLFRFCTSLTTVTMGNSVQRIYPEAFAGCSALTSVNIPDGVLHIDNNVFAGCSALTSITIPNYLTQISSSTFEGCTSLKSITIPDSVTKIDKNAFNGCTSLTSVTLGKGVISIGEYAFANCTALTPLTIPDSVTEIKKHAFVGCISLASVTFGKGIATIGYSAFAGCTSLTSIIIPDNVYRLEQGVFRNCSNLTSVTLGKGINKIELFAFSDCTSLKSITIPDNVEYLEMGVFSGCTSLTSVILGKGFNSIEAQTFANCTSLTSITIPDDVTKIGNNAFENCTSLTSVTLGKEIISIGEYAFKDCTTLATITIPENIKTIGKAAFSGCINLDECYCYATNPPSLLDAQFVNIKDDATLYVPKGSQDTYKKKGWMSYFKNIIEIEE